MAIILKGIDLPETNKSLYIRIFNGKIEIVHMLDAYEVEHTNAQAIQIPKGHGDIKDINIFLSDLRVYESKYCGEQGYITKDDIINAPTILEAERECERCKHKGDEYWCRDAYKDDEGKCSIYEPYGGMKCY